MHVDVFCSKHPLSFYLFYEVSCKDVNEPMSFVCIEKVKRSTWQGHCLWYSIVTRCRSCSFHLCVFELRWWFFLFRFM